MEGNLMIPLVNPLAIFLLIAVLSTLVAAIGIWLFPVREMQCNACKNTNRHEWKFTGATRQIKLTARTTSPTYYMVQCVKCQSRGWAMQRYLHPIWLVHEVPEGW